MKYLVIGFVRYYDDPEMDSVRLEVEANSVVDAVQQFSEHCRNAHDVLSVHVYNDELSK